MRFDKPMRRGILIQRYKRFLTDVELDGGGGLVTAACPNTGSMIGLTTPGRPVWLSVSDSPARKYPHTWELLEHETQGLIGINTGHPNKIVAEAIAAGRVPGLGGYASQRPEVKYGRNSRIDILLEDPSRPPCYVEVKNVHLLREPGLAEFPDCVTERGKKHLVELSDMVRGGARAVMVYLIQCATPRRFKLAHDLDPDYATAFHAARQAGVEAMAMTCHLSTEEIEVAEAIPVEDMR